jgi:hypothetical protein
VKKGARKSRPIPELTSEAKKALEEFWANSISGTYIEKIERGDFTTVVISDKESEKESV